jgi:hypothetical protein
MKRIGLMVSALLLSFSFAFAAPQVGFAAGAKDAVCEGVGLGGGGSNCGVPAGSKSVSDIVALVINILSVVVGVAAVIVLIFAGLRYILAAGDSAKISSAKDTILYAIIGLVVASLAQVIVRFVLTKL